MSGPDGEILRVEHLGVELAMPAGVVRAVDDVSFAMRAGEVLGVVGESGAGKSLLGFAIGRLLDPPARLAAGSRVTLEGRRVDDRPEAELVRLRGRRIGMVFQDPLTSLNPLFTVGEQLVETIRTHLPLSGQAARERAIAWLGEVGIPAAPERFDAYPHELSGGMRQRVVIALALCAEPCLVIADEPTTALDVSIQAQIIGVLRRVTQTHRTALLLITHDMGVIAGIADRVAVMYAGRIVEIGPVEHVLHAAAHPYTAALMASIPGIDAHVTELAQIPGSMPRPGALPAGCAFHPRCTKALAHCRERVPAIGRLADAPQDAAVACWLHARAPTDG